MKKLFFFFVFLISYSGFSQEINNDTVFVQKDSIIYNKDINFVEKRVFKENLKEKYSDKEFIYTEDLEEVNSTPANSSFLNGFVYFMKNIFPYLLGGIIIFIILKTFLGSEVGFWNFKKSKKTPSEKLVFEEEDIYEVDLERFLKNAIANKEYRLAIRYYYLSVLKGLSSKKIIEYHKDKTNTEYLLEIKDLNIQKEFSYLSYIYSYVWYGEFSVSEDKFKAVENKYVTFLKSNI